MGEVRKIFIVDTDPLFKSKVRKSLEAMGDIEVYGFVSGEECLSVLDAEPTAIIVDLFLESKFNGTMSGVHLLDAIKKERPDLDVLMLTPELSLTRTMTVVQDKAFDCIEKTDDNIHRIDSLMSIIIRHKEMEENTERYRNSMYLTVASCFALVLGFGGLTAW